MRKMKIVMEACKRTLVIILSPFALIGIIALTIMIGLLIIRHPILAIILLLLLILIILLRRV